MACVEVAPEVEVGLERIFVAVGGPEIAALSGSIRMAPADRENGEATPMTLAGRSSGGAIRTVRPDESGGQTGKDQMGTVGPSIEDVM